MAVLQDMRIIELLASRVCHDLISPVGAINNGIELMQEMGEQVGDEAVKLIGHSAEQASRRLRLFRLCYGAAGADSNLGLEDALNAGKEFLAGGRVQISWSGPVVNTLPSPPKGSAKVLLNLLVIALENLVHGGTIEVNADKDASPQLKLVVVGRGAGQRTEFIAPLKGEVAVEELTAKSIHPHITGKFAEHYGLTLGWAQPEEDRLELTLGYAPATV